MEHRSSCFFIGHRETPDRVYPTLLETIERHIAEYGVSEFVVGQYGNFDRLVIRALSQAKRAHPDIIPWRQSAAAMAAGSEWRIGITWIASGCLPSRQPCSADWRLTFEVKTWRSWSRSS